MKLKINFPGRFQGPTEPKRTPLLLKPWLPDIKMIPMDGQKVDVLLTSTT